MKILWFGDVYINIASWAEERMEWQSLQFVNSDDGRDNSENK